MFRWSVLDGERSRVYGTDGTIRSCQRFICQCELLRVFFLFLARHSVHWEKRERIVLRWRGPRRDGLSVWIRDGMVSLALSSVSKIFG